MPACTEDPIERLGVLLCCFRILPQHFADANDGVERRAQFMTHVGEELRFVLTSLCERTALFRDLAEQSSVLDCQNRLRGKCLEKLDRALAEFAWLFAPYHQRADNLFSTEQRHVEQCAKAGADNN